MPDLLLLAAAISHMCTHCAIGLHTRYVLLFFFGRVSADITPFSKTTTRFASTKGAWSDMLQLHTLGRLPLYTIHNSQFVRAGDAANDMILQFKISKRQEEVQTRGIATVQQHHAEQPAAIIGEFTALCKSLNNMQAGAAAQCYPTIRDLFLQDPAMVQRIVDNSRLEPHAAGRLGRLTAQDHVA